MIDELGYEQLKALRILSEKPDVEGTVLCKEADCSWGEMFDLAERGLIDVGADRLKPNCLHPTMTEAGRLAAAEAVTRGLWS